jgi:predicted permease
MPHDRDLDKELRFHVDERIDDLIATGLSADEARRRARLEFGGVLQVKEAVRDESWWRVFDGWERDVRLAVRALRRSPVFALTAALILGLGIGVNATVFSIVNTVMLRPLPLDRPDDIVRVRRRTPFGSSDSFPMHDYVALAEPQTSFSALAILDVAEGARSTLIVDGAAESVRLLHVSARFFDVLAVAPLNGRLFGREHDTDHAPVAVIAERFWRQRFAADPGIVGRPVSIGGQPHTILGVAPRAVEAMTDPDVFTLLPVPKVSSDRTNSHQVLARIKPGVDRSQAQAEIDAVARRHAEASPALTNMPQGVVLRSLQEDAVAPVQQALRLLTVAVLLVLLIACSNVANVVLARGFVRRRELALMAALGSARWRVVRSVITENVVVAAIGGGLGVLLAYAGLKVLPALSVTSLPQADRIRVDGWVLLFVAGAAILSGLLASLPLTIRLARIDLIDWLKQGTGQADAGIGGRRLRSVLAGFQVALSTLLLVGAGLLVRSFWNLASVDPGFRADRVLTLAVSLAPPRYPDSASVGAYTEAVTERLEQIPGVVAASSTTALPSEFPLDFPVTVVGRDQPGTAGSANTNLDAWYRAINPNFFSAMGIPLLVGRSFDRRDSPAGEPVIIISQRLAQAAFPHGDAIGRSVVIGEGYLKDARDLRPRIIVGVVGDTRERGLRYDATMTMYIPVGQTPELITRLVVNQIPVRWVVRTSGAPSELAPSIRQAMLAFDPTQAPSDFSPLSDVLARSIASNRFNMLMLSLFGALALTLAAIGVYGLVAYAVAQRTREIGIRLSLGARPRRVVWEIVGQGLRLCLIGVATGTAASFGLGRVLGTMLFGVNAVDATTVAIVISILTAVVVAATYVPASRAASIDPVRALRQE